MSKKKMQALVYTANKKMTFRDEEIPEPRAGEALIALELIGICGSDMHAYLGHDERRVPPLILGHEAVGTVVQGLNPGQRVALNPLITCGKCHDCLSGRQNLCANRDLIGMYRAGAFAQYITIEEKNLIPIPESMSFSDAVLVEPGATGLHAVLLAERSLARPISETKALVIGAGSVGLLTALILLDKGVNKVDLLETNILRREMIKKHTNCNVINPITNPPETSSYDLVFDAVGNAQTRKTSVEVAKPGSVIVHIGLMDNETGLDIRRITLQEIIFIGCYTYTPIDLQITLDKLNQGALGDLGWVKQLPLSDGDKAFADLLEGRCAAPKVVLKVN